ncbi:ATP-binding protein [Coralloluteibacterium thermophilus]|uniref:ATP-binding protein n=1 Tax=Coralloluteibacterium thermophilum TaxID=2707049 RepID=A0ABV9NNH6_9GAMM
MAQIHCQVTDASEVGQARRVGAGLAREAGLDETEAGRLAIVVTELGNNQVRHAGGGELLLRAMDGPRQGVEVLAIDRGRGFDPARCLVDGYSTAGTAGTGLGAIQRLSSTFDLWSDARGSVLVSRIERGRPGARAPSPDWGVVNLPLPGEQDCGDTWCVRPRGDGVLAIVIDGLGHGSAAAAAARAGRAGFEGSRAEAPDEVLEAVHAAMAGTRGGAVSVAGVDPARGRVVAAGIGNVGVLLATAERSRGLPSQSGIVGQGPARRRQSYALDFEGGARLLMFSDGLQSRFSLRDYPGLLNYHPAVLAGVLYRDFRRGNDDVTVLALSLGSSA